MEGSCGETAFSVRVAARGSVCAGQCSDRAGAAFDCFGGSAATDFDFERVQGVIAHEYFHNWTGNRVTCRDWFQLTLKEGLTVFRDRQVCAKARLRRAASVHAFAAFLPRPSDVLRWPRQVEGGMFPVHHISRRSAVRR